MTITIVIGYLVLVTLAGTSLARRNHSSEDWASGGGGMGMLLIVAGVAGTRIGGVGIYGVASDVMNTGIWNLWYGITTFLAFVVMAFLFVIPYRRLKLNTTGEIFLRRFGSKRARVLGSFCVQTEYFIVSVLEPYVIGLILSSVTGMPLGLGILIATGVIISYTAMSGIQGASLTNIIHCTVIVVTLATIALLAMDNLGGWAAVVDKTDAALAASGKDSQSWWSLTGMGWIPVIAMCFSAVIHTPAASIYTNYANSARSERILIPAFILAGVLGASMPFLAGIIGIEAVAEYGATPTLKGFTSITQLATDTGAVLGGLAVAAIIAALISSASPILLGGATMVVNDWLPGADKMSTDGKLKAYRVTAVLYGCTAALIAYFANISSIMQLLLLGFAMVVPPAIAISFVIYWRRTTEQAVFWGMACGYGAGLLTWISNTWFDLGPAPAYLTTTVPLLLIPLVSLLTKAELTRAEDFYQQLKCSPHPTQQSALAEPSTP
jgi:Na+/proline symporter